MTKNFYITSLYKIDELPNETYNMYALLLDKSIETIKKYLKGDYEIIIIKKNKKKFCDIFYDQFIEIYNIYKKNYPCNILYCGSDVLFHNDCNIFDEFDDFRLFNYTTVIKYPLSYNDKTNNYLKECLKLASKYNLTINYLKNNQFLYFEHYLNCDIRYFSKNMNNTLFEYGLELINIWKNKYDFFSHGDQFIYNFMLWSQHNNINKVIIPKYGYQFVNTYLEGNDKFNNISIKDAQIIHIHLSIFTKLVLYETNNLVILNKILQYINTNK